MLNKESIKSLTEKVGWFQVAGHSLCIIVLHMAVIFIGGMFLVMAGAIIDVERIIFSGMGGVSWIYEVFSALLILSAYTFFFYRATGLAKKHPFIHVISVATIVFFIFIVLSVIIHGNAWYEHYVNIPFTYGTALTGYIAWYWKKHKSLRHILKK